MPNDAGSEWTRLTRLYAEKSDEELLDLAEDFGNLTEVAQGVLRDEMRKRKLEVAKTLSQTAPPPMRPELRETTPISGFARGNPVFGRWTQGGAEENRGFEGPREESAEDEDAHPVEYTWKTLLCECNEKEEAWQIAEVLRRAKIESWIEGPSSPDSLDARGPRVMVAADQLDDARAIAARPIPQDVIDQSREKVEDFVPPKCPKCGGVDPLLESVEPVNSWLCESCGARWSDAAGVENEVQNRR